MEKIVDRRVRKTKKLIRQGLAQLMKEKSIMNISVQELADLVDINRGTFYIHYRDIFDLLEQIENEIFDTFSQLVEQHKADQSKNDPLPLLIDIYASLSDNREMTVALLGKNGDAAFIDRMKDLILKKCFLEWARTFKFTDDKKFEYFCSFMVSGCIGMVEQWLQDDEDKSPTEIANMVKVFIMNGTAVLN